MGGGRREEAKGEEGEVGGGRREEGRVGGGRVDILDTPDQGLSVISCSKSRHYRAGHLHIFSTFPI